MEDNIYYKKLQKKKTKDLELMFRYPRMYEPKALEAAKYIIEHRATGKEAEPEPIKVVSERSKKNDPYTEFFQTRFFRVFSTRDIFSAIAVALALIALMNLLNFYDGEGWLENKWYANRLLYIFLAIPILHILYKKDHRRSNDFFGRCLHIIIFIIASVLIQQIYLFAFYGEFSLSFSDIPIYLLPLFMMIIVAILELPSTFFNFILSIFKWRVW